MLTIIIPVFNEINTIDKILDEVNKINFTYLKEKWGEDYNMVSPHWNPFRNGEFPQSYTTFNLDFVRKKYLGF